MPYAEKTQGDKRPLAANSGMQKVGPGRATPQFVDRRPQTAALRELQGLIDKSPRMANAGNFQNQGLHPLEQLDYIAGTPVQDVGTEGNLLPVYVQAWEVIFNEFKPKVEAIGRRVKAVAQIATLKEKGSAERKIRDEYGGASNKVVDIGRASITCKTAAQAIQAYREIERSFTIVRVKNRFKTPAGGYRDMLLNVKLANNHIAEIQIHLEEIVRIKNNEGHKLYEIIRVLEAKSKRGDITADEVAEMDRAKTEMQRVYDEAWERAKGVPDK